MSDEGRAARARARLLRLPSFALVGAFGAPWDLLDRRRLVVTVSPRRSLRELAKGRVLVSIVVDAEGLAERAPGTGVLCLRGKELEYRLSFSAAEERTYTLALSQRLDLRTVRTFTELRGKLFADEGRLSALVALRLEVPAPAESLASRILSIFQ